MFGDADYFARKYPLLDCTELQILEHRAERRRFQIKCRYLAKADAPVPAFARKFVADRNCVVQQDSWDLDAATGRLEVQVGGLPVRVAARMTLVATRGGCVNHFLWNINCAVPLVGAKIEQLVAADIRRKAAKDLAISRRLLQEY